MPDIMFQIPEGVLHALPWTARAQDATATQHDLTKPLLVPEGSLMRSPIYSCRVTTLRDELWSQVLWRATQRVCLLIGCKLLGEAEVSKLQVAIRPHQQVLWFQISARHTFCGMPFLNLYLKQSSWIWQKTI